MFKHIPNEKGMAYGHNGKGIMASMEYSLIIYSPNGRGMVLWDIVFQEVTVMVKEKKYALQKIQCQSKLVLCITGIILREQE